MNDRDFLEYFEKLNKNPLPKPELFSIVSSLTNTLLISSHSQPTPIKPPTKPSIFGPGVPEDVEYSLKRAVKALCTTDFQLQARYSLVLQNFLRHFPVKTDKFMDFLLKECNVSNAIRKSETSHYVFASLLGFSALDQARKLDDEASFRVFLEKMLEIAEKYTSFRETVAQILENSLLSQENATKALKTRFRAISQRIKGEPFENSVFHINLLVSLQKAAKIAPKLEDFPLKSQLHANLLDYSRVLRLLLSSLEVFPRESCIIRSVIDFTDLYIRENHKTEEHWSGFFEYFSKELAQSGQTRAFDYKKAFLLLSLLYRYLKKPGFSAIALKNVAKEPLVSLWLRNLFVQNEVLRKISRKIERRVTQIFENAGNCLENREACVEFVEKMKKSLNYHFTGSCALAQAFFQHVIAEDQSFIESYWKILKKKLQKSESLQEKLYIVSEIVHFFERKQGNIKENLLLEGILSVFKEISREKIRKLLENEENFEALEENSMNFEKEAEKFEEKLYDSFYSLLGEVNKRPSSNFSKEKAAIWKGLSEKNEILLSLVLKECEKTQKNKRAEFIEKIEILAADVQRNIEKMLKAQDFSRKMQIKREIAIVSLLSCVGLMSFQSPEESFDTLQELFAVVEEKSREETGDLPNKKKRKLNNGKDIEIPTDKQKWSLVLMDIFVALLAKSPNFLRECVRKTFLEFVAEVDEQVLGNFVAVITRKNEEYLADMQADDEDL